MDDYGLERREIKTTSWPKFSRDEFITEPAEFELDVQARDVTNNEGKKNSKYIRKGFYDVTINYREILGLSLDSFEIALGLGLGRIDVDCVDSSVKNIDFIGQYIHEILLENDLEADFSVCTFRPSQSNFNWWYDNATFLLIMDYYLCKGINREKHGTRLEYLERTFRYVSGVIKEKEYNWIFNIVERVQNLYDTGYTTEGIVEEFCKCFEIVVDQ